MARTIRVCHVITLLELGGAQENTIASVLGLRTQPGMCADLISGPTVGPEGSLESTCAPVPGLRRPVPGSRRQCPSPRAQPPAPGAQWSGLKTAGATVPGGAAANCRGSKASRR